MKANIVIVLISLSSIAFAQNKPAYLIYTSDGKATDYVNLINEAAKNDIIFFGELHDNSIAHWLELQVTKDLFAKDNTLSLGMEMFEADNQLILDEYLNGLIDEKLLLNEAKVWDNYKNDYKPLIEFAKENKLKVIATNVPRRYANMVYKKGIESLETLQPDAKKFIAPLPIAIDLTLPGYKNMISQMGGHGSATAGENIAKSQAVKDATMAYFILQNKKGKHLHFNGSYHSQNKEGIVWYLLQANSKQKIFTVQVVEQKDIGKLEGINKNLADFIICVPDDMTKTY
jgi:uncharacterized iron-regulated protein